MSNRDILESIYAEMQKHTRLLEQMAAQPTVNSPTNPMPPTLQEKLLRMGYGNWTPTPGVFDEDTEVYMSIDANTHLYVMSVEEALALNDDELKWKFEGVSTVQSLREKAIAEYERRVVN